jgi:hypothetical protein
MGEDFNMTVYWSDEVRENEKPNRIEVERSRKKKEQTIEDRPPTKAELLEGQGLR